MSHIVKTPPFIGYGEPDALRAAIEAVKAVHGVSQRGQADAIGVGWTTMRNWLNGTASWPKSAQVALEVWADTPRNEDEACLLDHAWFVASVEDRDAMLAAWKEFKSTEGSYTLEVAVADWTQDQLLSFVRDGTKASWFCAAVDAQHEVELSDLCRGVIHAAAHDYLKDAVLYQLAWRLEEVSE